MPTPNLTSELVAVFAREAILTGAGVRSVSAPLGTERACFTGKTHTSCKDRKIITVNTLQFITSSTERDPVLQGELICLVNKEI